MSVGVFQAMAQDELNTLNTACPFLMISPDARGGGMGDIGVSSSPDAASMHWNPAKYAFAENEASFQVSYVPWLRELVDDIGLSYLAGYYKIDERQTVAASLKYFSLGEITFTDINGLPQGDYKPNEFAVDATYSRKFSPKWSGAVAARFIYSNLTLGQEVQGQQTYAGKAVAADIAVYHEDKYVLGNGMRGTLAFGINISNIGSKISYSSDADADFLPTNLRIGPSFRLDLDEFNSITVFVEVNKLLVPTPPVYATDSMGNPIIDPSTGKYEIESGKDPDVSVFKGMIQSFGDAPGGFKEEMKEFQWSVGAEYWYSKMLGIRAGYFHEAATKGNRQYFTLGAGIRYNVFGLEAGYLIPTNSQASPQDNTLRFTLSFNF